MTESVPRIQRHITTATGMPTGLNRPGVAPADSAEGRAGVESVLEPAVAEAPILITEQEVLLSTAAAVTVLEQEDRRSVDRAAAPAPPVHAFEGR